MRTIARTQPYRRTTKPRIEITGSEGSKLTVTVDGEEWSDSRVNAAIGNHTHYCRCKNCNSCLVGAAYLRAFDL